MALPAFLAMRFRGSPATQQVYSYAGATRTVVGDSLEAALSARTDAKYANFVIKCMENTDPGVTDLWESQLYAVGHNAVWKKDDPTSMVGTWSAD